MDRTYTDSRSTSAMRVCQPGPVAFQRASVSGANLRLIATFESGDLGRPRGLSMLAAVRAPKILGSTSLAGRAFAIMAAVHSGFVRLVLLVLGCFLISPHLSVVLHSPCACLPRSGLSPSRVARQGPEKARALKYCGRLSWDPCPLLYCIYVYTKSKLASLSALPIRCGPTFWCAAGHQWP